MWLLSLVWTILADSPVATVAIVIFWFMWYGIIIGMTIAVVAYLGWCWTEVHCLFALLAAAAGITIGSQILVVALIFTIRYMCCCGKPSSDWGYFRRKWDELCLKVDTREYAAEGVARV